MLRSLWPDRWRGEHQYAIDLPGYVALEAADDLSLALARLRQRCALLHIPPACDDLVASEPDRSCTAHGWPPGCHLGLGGGVLPFQRRLPRATLRTDWRRKPRSSTSEDCLRPRSAASRRGRFASPWLDTGAGACETNGVSASLVGGALRPNPNARRRGRDRGTLRRGARRSGPTRTQSTGASRPMH